jgi:hypothetical protein
VAAAVVHLNTGPLQIPAADLAPLADELVRISPPVHDARRHREDARDLAERIDEIRSSNGDQRRLFLGRDEQWLLLRATDSLGRGRSTKALDLLHFQLRTALDS